ncbi:hypothetical protein [Lactiplantibacillus plantarum]|uniref:hypothetical protein n=1 Tax=Lactiplantibacillus plantarum TaxID=1590 RepID=UPI003F530A7D
MIALGFLISVRINYRICPLKQNVANELARRAKGKELTASRYLEQLLKKEFNL